MPSQGYSQIVQGECAGLRQKKRPRLRCSARGPIGPFRSLEWWNRGESNPRPQAIAERFYMRSCLIWI
jgi:hypothetical protein